MNYNKFQIFEFKLSQMVKDPAIVMIAKRGSGKSFISRDIMYHYRHIPGGVVISPSDEMDFYFKYFFPDLYIHYDISDVLFKKILLRQHLMIAKAKDKKKVGLKIDPSALLIMDDCLAKKSTWVKDESIAVILLNGRHLKLTYLLTMQTPLGIQPHLRLNFDYIFLLKDDCPVQHKKIWDNYAGIFPTLASFNKVFAACTEDFKAMVVDNRKPANNIHDKIFWFKAQKRKFSFGSKTFKDLHKKYYDPNFSKKKLDALLGVEALCTKRKKELDIGVVLK
jgi:hypothetical protein